jgi:uncharacterized membrane protein
MMAFMIGPCGEELPATAAAVVIIIALTRLPLPTFWKIAIVILLIVIAAVGFAISIKRPDRDKTPPARDS